MLAAILAVISSGIDLGVRIAMLVTYSVGNSILIVAVGAGIGTVNQLGGSARFAKAGKWVKSRSWRSNPDPWIIFALSGLLIGRQKE